ncbi:tyrosine-type recombinase/integrase [Geomonas agri]|uniref:tyrosine-type recombinase/integrase n=1 Tax=Geomonas agri TaxID=2873702 RepID=UPI001CD507B8|nr:site-specific integrase [Geomonas agri]
MAVYKRGEKGVFYMNFTVGGVRIFKSTGKFTKREAKQVEANERQKLMDEASLSPQERAGRMLLLEAIDVVYEVRWKHTKDAERSYSRARSIANHIGNIPLKDIGTAMVTKLMQGLEKEKARNGTINRYLAALKTILNHHEQGIRHVKLRKESKGRIRVVSREEETRVVELLRYTIHNKRRQHYPEVAALVEVLVDTGMRLSELLNLTYEDIDFEANLISIWINKGDRPRSIPMTKRVKAIMKARSQKKSKPFDLQPYQAENAWRWVRKEMGLDKDGEFILHALRHTCASRLVNKGIDLYVVRDWLGHSSIQVTERYAHLAPNKLAHAALVLEIE